MTSQGRSTRPLAGHLARPDGWAERTNPCGDLIRIEVRLVNGIVTEASCTVHGCATALACANAAAALARGMSVADAIRTVTTESIIEVLGGLPPDHEDLAAMAARTLHGAVEDAILCSRESWKKLYR